MNDEPFIERHILIGLIVSDKFLESVHEDWNARYIQSSTARRMASWCLEYYQQYNRAPGQDIEGIYFEHLEAGDIPEDEAEELEEDILPGLSEEYEHAENFNVDYLLDRTENYFSKRSLELHQDEIKALKDEGRIQEAEEKAQSYNPPRKESRTDINLANPDSLDRVTKAFESSAQPIVEYPGALGEMLNAQLTRDAFVAFLAPEKRGKSFMLLDLARRAVRQRLNVAFFQAGDMSEAQQLRRLGINLAKRSDREEYCGEQYQAVKDCKLNQLGECDKEVREVIFGLEGDDAPHSAEAARDQLSFNKLVELYNYEANRDYRPCHNCKEYQQRGNQLGCAWIKKVNPGRPLEQVEARQIFEDYFVENKRQFMISTHANGTLSVPKMESKLDQWYRQGFVPDVIICDYADLLTAYSEQYRHKQDEIWKGMRRVSEERHCLFVTASQADANSYEQGLLTMANFSEDKRKFGHVTSMFGLNQDPEGKEKEIGIMRVNCLVARESDTSPGRVVHVLQNLKRGQPVLTSYW